MSSCGNPEVETQALMQGRKKYDKSAMCIKCKSARGNLVIRHAVYCKACFLPFVTHKFRRAFEPYLDGGGSGRRTRRADTDADSSSSSSAESAVLIGMDGSLGASVLLDLMKDSYFAPPVPGISNGRPRVRRPWKRAYACYVEVCGAFPDHAVPDRSEEIRAAVQEQTDFEFVLARVEDAFDLCWWREVVGHKPDLQLLGVDLNSEELPLLPLPSTSSPPPDQFPPVNPKTRLRAYLASLPTPSAARAALSTLVRGVLLHTAARLRCTHLTLGTPLTALSISLLSAMSHGAGANVPEAFAEEWRPPPSSARVIGGQDASDTVVQRVVRIVRPLQDVGVKECAAYARWQRLPVVPARSLPGLGGKATIGGLTTDFIVGLERDYPSTVSAIVRTCAKLVPRGEREGTCVLCQRPFVRGVLEWKARISIRSLKPADKAASGYVEPLTPPARHTQTLAPRLCYACHTHLTSRAPRPRGTGASATGSSSVLALPVWTCAALRSGHEEDDGSDGGGANDGEAGGEENGGEVWRTQRMSRDEMRGAVGAFLLDGVDAAEAE